MGPFKFPGAVFLGAAVLLLIIVDSSLAKENHKARNARRKRSPTDYSSGSGTPPYSGSGTPPYSGSGSTPYNYSGSGTPPYSGSGTPPYSGSGYPPYSGSGYPPYSGSGYPPYSGSGYPPYNSGGGSGSSCPCNQPKPNDCTGSSRPIDPGQPACSCTKTAHPPNCTLQACKSSDNGAGDYKCLCDGANINGGNCYGPTQVIFTTGSMNVLGLADLMGINPNAAHQLGVALGDNHVLGGTEDSSELFVNLLGTLGGSGSSLPLTNLLGGGSPLGNVLDTGSILGGNGLPLVSLLGGGGLPLGNVLDLNSISGGGSPLDSLLQANALNSDSNPLGGVLGGGGSPLDSLLQANALNSDSNPLGGVLGDSTFGSLLQADVLNGVLSGRSTEDVLGVNLLSGESSPFSSLTDQQLLEVLALNDIQNLPNQQLSSAPQILEIVNLPQQASPFEFLKPQSKPVILEEIEVKPQKQQQPQQLSPEQIQQLRMMMLIQQMKNNAAKQ